MMRRYLTAASVVTVLLVSRGHVSDHSIVHAAGRFMQGQVDETAMRQALQRYSDALESLDANAVKKIQPSVPVENLAKAFKDMRELKVDIDAVPSFQPIQRQPASAAV